MEIVGEMRRFLTTRRGDGMHRGINSPASPSGPLAHGKELSHVFVFAGLISSGTSGLVVE